MKIPQKLFHVRLFHLKAYSQKPELISKIYVIIVKAELVSGIIPVFNIFTWRPCFVKGLLKVTIKNFM